MAAVSRPGHRKIPPREQVKIVESELADYELAYFMLETGVEYIIAQITLEEQDGCMTDVRWVRNLLETCLLKAQEHTHDSPHPTDLIDKIFCDRCHTFFSEASEQAGYCIKCERS